MARHVCLALLAAFFHEAASYSLSSSFIARPVTRISGKSNLRMESFGLDFAEDPVRSGFIPKEISGEARLKGEYVPKLAAGKVVERPFLTEDYPLLDRVAEMRLLTATADSGILSALSTQGLTLSQIEQALPLVEELELVPFLVGNKPLLLNLLAPLLVEPAPLLLGPLAAALRVSAGTYLAVAGAAAVAEAASVSGGDGVNVPLALVLVLSGGLGAILNTLTSLPSASSPRAKGAASFTSSSDVPVQSGLRI